MDYPRRGEIWRVALGAGTGSEIVKTRPAVIISNNVNNQYAQTVTVLPVTSNIARAYPFETILESETTGLLSKSKVKCNQVRTVDKRRLVKKTGFLSGEELRRVENALLIHLDIETPY
ncbi:MAG TPA: type II toxin-antitoxin system PemK/MazF family toxin [bacterium]|nr:type II toxin-antitoxin system PemK/MazF family toxin [bacterium]